MKTLIFAVAAALLGTVLAGTKTEVLTEGQKGKLPRQYHPITFIALQKP